MRITREWLMRITKKKVFEMTYSNRHIICAYLTGSMLLDQPFLGGTTDIDLVSVHDSEPEIEREILPICDEVHLDISHLSYEKFNQPRRLRTDPWIGSFLCQGPLQLYDSKHWFEYTQASVCAQFHRPEYIIERAMPFVENARKIWMDINADILPPGPQKTYSYLKSLEYAANAIACLTHVPLTERRLVMDLPKVAQRIGRPGLASGLIDLFTSEPIPQEEWEDYLKFWQNALSTVGNRDNCPVRLHPGKKPYYESATAVMYDDYPSTSIWILLRTWTNALCFLSESTPTRKRWQKLCAQLKLDDENFDQRITELDHYLDTVEESLDIWAKQNGIL